MAHLRRDKNEERTYYLVFYRLPFIEEDYLAIRRSIEEIKTLLKDSHSLVHWVYEVKSSRKNEKVSKLILEGLV